MCTQHIVKYLEQWKMTLSLSSKKLPLEMPQSSLIHDNPSRDFSCPHGFQHITWANLKIMWYFYPKLVFHGHKTKISVYPLFKVHTKKCVN